MDLDPLVGPQRPGQLAVADVHGDHLPGARAQQHVGEPARRRTGVEAAAPGDRETQRLERRQRAGQLVAAAGDVVGPVRVLGAPRSRRRWSPGSRAWSRPLPTPSPARRSPARRRAPATARARGGPARRPASAGVVALASAPAQPWPGWSSARRARRGRRARAAAAPGRSRRRPRAPRSAAPRAPRRPGSPRRPGARRSAPAQDRGLRLRSPACSSGSGTSCVVGPASWVDATAERSRRRSRPARRRRRGAATPPTATTRHQSSALPSPATTSAPSLDAGASSRPADRRRPSDSGRRVRLVQPTQVARDVGRPHLGPGRAPARPDRSPRSCTSSESTPASCAPSMSVSSRSPTISGRSPPHRRMVSSSSGRAGLPGDHRLDPGEPAQGLHQHAVTRRHSERRRERQVGVGRHPPQPVADPHRGPHDVAATARRGRSRSPPPPRRRRRPPAPARPRRPRRARPPPPSTTTRAPAPSRSASTPRRGLGRGHHVVRARLDPPSSRR